MFRSKSTRFGSFDFGKKDRPSIISRTFSASKICRGDPLVSHIDAKAVKPVEQKPSKKQLVRISTMQQQMSERLEEELKMTRDQVGAVEEERDRAFDELREMKILAREANMKLSEALSNSTKELKMKERNIESLKQELEKAKQFEVKLAERDVSCEKLREELRITKASEARTMELLSESKRRIEELEDEFERGKVSETKMYATLVSKTKQLEKTKVELEQSKLEVASLRSKKEKVEVTESRDLVAVCNHENVDSMKEAVESLRSDLQLVKENLVRAQQGEKIASSKAKNLQGEMNLLRSEMKFAMEAEEKSKKAMDDLALALKEVATEANQAKEKLSLSELRLEHVKQEAEQSKITVRSVEDRYKKLLDEANKETERHKNTVERLRLEAEESLLAWNEREIGLVNCMKRVEEERALAQQENTRLMKSLKAAGNTSSVSREESFKLRDILKQALNEASVAKEAAAIARAENSQLKDSHAEKDEALDMLTRENERLRINEAAAQESIKALKRLLSAASTKESKTGNKGQGGKFKSNESMAKEAEDEKKHNRAFSFDLSELNFPNGLEEDVNVKVLDEDPVKAETLKGSIFDNVDSPKSDPHTPHHRRVLSKSFTDDGKSIYLEDSDHKEGPPSFDDDRNFQRKSRQLLRRFGDLVKRKSSFRKEPSIE